MHRPFDLLRFRLTCWTLAVALAACGAPAGDGETRVLDGARYSFLEHLGDSYRHSGVAAGVESGIVTAGGVERPAIAAPAPSEVRFEDLPVHAGAVLRFGAGIDDGAVERRRDGVRFTVRVAAGGGPEAEVWSREVLPGDEGQRRWHDAEVDLKDFAGRTVDVVLLTEDLGDRRGQRSAWSAPELRSQGREVALEELPVFRELLVEDLRSPPRTRLRLEVPPRAKLVVAGEIRRRRGGQDPEPMGPMEFRVRVDGEPVLRRPLRGRVTTGFDATVDLGELAGRTVDLELEIEAGARADAEEIDAEWLRAAVLRSEPVPRAPASAGRNLLLVVVDTLRADHMSVYGYGRDTTPNLKRLAEESAVFERAISQSSWTMPATASLLTGLQPPEHGVTDGQALEPRFDTLAEALQAAGLTTFAVSANPVVGREEGFDQGFERFVHLPWARAGHVGDAFRAFVEESRGRRWFAYLHYVDPHDPYDAPGDAGRAFTGGLSSRYGRVAEFRKLFYAVNFGRGKAPLSDRDLAYLEAAYDGEILYWDEAFGRLVDELRGLGSLDDTVVVVTSDHGEEFMDHGRLKHAHQLYEESIWVPLIVRAPGLVDVGRHSRPLETRRLFDAIRGWMTAEKRGADDLLAAPGPIFSQTSHNFLHEGRRRNELAAVRDGDWKLIWSPRTESVELYHLSEDPGEQADRSAAEPERRDRYRELLGRWLAQGGADAEGQPAEATVEELRALGYVQ